MTAKEIFEELGYKQFIDNDTIRYRCLTDYVDYSVVFHTGGLFLKTYDVNFVEWRDIKSDDWVPMEKRKTEWLKHCAKYGHWQRVDYGIDVKLHKAINKQVEELGWGDKN